MTDKIRLADQIDRTAQVFKAFIDSAAEIRKIGQLEQVAAEAKKAADASRKEADDAAAEVKKHKEEAKKAKDKVTEILEAADAKGADVIAQAKIDADKILADATVKAGNIVVAASATGATRADELRSIVIDLTDKRDALVREATGIRESIDQLTAEADDAEKRLAKAQAQIDKLLGK